ncbi:MAG TPA: GTP cyclohydrolase I, partial [Candidatus Limnocylindria bacterium]|nr:GTP cyclohydrolase I [Candidatus Limnocylindria bacterium]
MKLTRDERAPLVEEIELDIGDEGDGAGTGVASFEAAVRQILADIGEDPTRDGLRGTPARVERMYRELTAGYDVDPERLLNRAVFEVDYSEMVV